MFLCTIFLTLLLSGCRTNNLLPDNPKNKLETGIFMEEEVVLTDGLTQKILNETPEEFMTNLLNKNNNSARINNELELGITMKELVEFQLSKMENYPEFDMENLQIKRLGVLKKDFPNIKTKEDAFKISGKIVEFYDLKLRQDLKDNLDELRKKTSKGRKLAGIGDANAMEITYSGMHPLAGTSVYQGAQNADAWTKEKFNTNLIDLNDKVNAYRHSIWAMASAATMLIRGMPKFDAMGKTRDFLTIHEMEYKGNINGIKPTVLPAALYALHLQWGLGTSNLNAMDLSNDAIGRSLIENQTSWGLFSGWSGVSKTAIMNTMATKVAAGVSYNKSPNIISAYHNNNWQAIANNIYAGLGVNLYIID